MNKKTLVLVQIFFRHGNRTPVREGSYKGDPYIDYSYFPYAGGDLTEKGRKRSYALGKCLKERYKSLMDREFYYDMVKAYTSDFRRTKMTLQIVLAAMFPPKDKCMIIEEGLNWQPISYDYEPMMEDKHIARFLRCTRLFERTYQQIDNDTQNVIDYVEKHLGWRPRRPLDVNLIFDTIKVQQDNEMEVPSWASEIYPEKLTNEYIKYMTDGLSDKEILKEGFGAQLNRMDNYLWAKANGDLTEKFIFYSGHDYNIYMMLETLGNFKQQLVPCLGNIIWELHQINEEYFVKVFYDDFEDPLREPLQLQIPGCELNCPLRQFSQFISEYFPVE